MPEVTPQNTPRLSPYLYYEDVAGMLDWLHRAFGLRERLRIAGPDGAISHAEMEFDDAVIMMGCPGPDYRNPKHLGQATQSLYILVEDVDDHFRKAQVAGAKILEEPADQEYGDRRYGAEDPEGHQWYFAQHIGEDEP